MSRVDLEVLERELAWFAAALDARFTAYFPREPGAPSAIVDLPAPPDHGEAPAALARLLREHPLALGERLALALALAVHLRPQLLDVFHYKNATFDRRFTEFGGVRSDDEFEPTGDHGIRDRELRQDRPAGDARPAGRHDDRGERLEHGDDGRKRIRSRS